MDWTGFTIITAITVLVKELFKQKHINKRQRQQNRKILMLIHKQDKTINIIRYLEIPYVSTDEKNIHLKLITHITSENESILQKNTELTKLTDLLQQLLEND